MRLWQSRTWATFTITVVPLKQDHLVAPVELVGFAWRKAQRDVSPPLSIARVPCSTVWRNAARHRSRRHTACPRSSSKIRINVSCSRADLAAFAARNPSSSDAQPPSFGRGCTGRSYLKDVSPDRSTFRTVFRDTFRSRAISLIVLPLMKCSRRIRRNRLHDQHPPPPASFQSRQRNRPNWRGSILDADPPA